MRLFVLPQVTRSPALDDVYAALDEARTAYRLSPSQETAEDLDAAQDDVDAAELASLTRGFARGFSHTH